MNRPVRIWFARHTVLFSPLPFYSFLVSMKTSCLTFAISPPELHLVKRGTSFVSLWWVPWDFFFNASTEPGTVFRPSLPHSHDFVFSLFVCNFICVLCVCCSQCFCNFWLKSVNMRLQTAWFHCFTKYLARNMSGMLCWFWDLLGRCVDGLVIVSGTKEPLKTSVAYWKHLTEFPPGLFGAHS